MESDKSQNVILVCESRETGSDMHGSVIEVTESRDSVVDMDCNVTRGTEHCNTGIGLPLPVNSSVTSKTGSVSADRSSEEVEVD